MRFAGNLDYPGLAFAASRQFGSLRMRQIIFTIALSILLTTSPASADVAENLPNKIDSSKSWVFYAHGSAVYLKNKTAGWKKKSNALSNAGYHVITEERFDLDEETTYAEKVVTQVNTLLARGVPAVKIYIGGYSRGAIIALDVATRLKNPELNFFLIAGCKQDSELDDGVQGRFLSLAASEDEKDYGSCAQFLTDKPGVKLTERIYANKGHKYFTGMNSAWFSPLRSWMKAIEK